MQIDVPEASVVQPGNFGSYRLVVSEESDSWELQRRWNDLKLMHQALQPALQALDPRVRSTVPRFEAHSWRIAGSQLDPAFLETRREAMQGLLRVLVAVFEVSIASQAGPTALLDFLAPGGRPGDTETPIRARGPTAESPTPLGDMDGGDSVETAVGEGAPTGDDANVNALDLNVGRVEGASEHCVAPEADSTAAEQTGQRKTGDVVATASVSASAVMDPTHVDEGHVAMSRYAEAVSKSGERVPDEDDEDEMDLDQEKPLSSEQLEAELECDRLQQEMDAQPLSLVPALMWVGILLLPVIAVVAKEMLGKTWGTPTFDDTDVFAAMSAAIKTSENMTAAAAPATGHTAD